MSGPPGGAGSYAHHNPATGEVQARVPLAGAADVDAAVAAARARAAGVARDAAARAHAALHRLADLLTAIAPSGAINALDNGTPISAMNPGVYTARLVRYYAGLGRQARGRGRAGHRGAVRLRACPSPTA